MGTLDDGSVTRRRSGDLNEHAPQLSLRMDDKRVVLLCDELFVCRGNGSDEILGDSDA